MANVLNIYRSKRTGLSGDNGKNGSGTSDIRSSIVDNPILDILHNNKEIVTGDLTWLRAGEAVINDRYGVDHWISNDDITNQITQSNDFTLWSDALNRWTRIGATTDPLGGANATEFNLDVTTTVDQVPVASIERGVSGLTGGKAYTISFDFKIISGTVSKVQIYAGSDYFEVDVLPTTSYQRMKATFFAGASGLIFGIHPVGISGARFAIYEVMYELGSVAHAPINTTTVPVTIAGSGSAARQNQLGYLIEESKTNLVKNSEDLNAASWTLSSGTITKSTDTFGQQGKDIVINIDSQQTATLTGTGAYSQGVTYTISCDVHLTSGSATMLVAVGGGDQVAFPVLPTDKITRLSVEVIAGSGGSDIIFRLNSNNLSGKILLTSIQAELGALSSYIRNGNAANTRPTDSLTIPYESNFPLPSDSWTLFFNHKLIVNDSNKKYIFDNGLTGVSEFSAYFENSDFKVKNGTQLVTLTSGLTSNDLAVTFNSSNMLLYKDGNLDSTIAITSPSTTTATTMSIGSDSANNNAVNAYLSLLRFYNKTLTADEIKYLSGATV